MSELIDSSKHLFIYNKEKSIIPSETLIDKTSGQVLYDTYSRDN